MLTLGFQRYMVLFLGWASTSGALAIFRRFNNFSFVDGAN